MAKKADVVVPAEMRQYADALVADTWRALTNLRDLAARKTALRRSCEVMCGWGDDSDDDRFRDLLKATGYEEVNDMFDLIAGWLVGERNAYRPPFHVVDETTAARKARKIVQRRVACSR